MAERGHEQETVFVVDDDDAARDSVCVLLDVNGFRTAGMASAEALLAALSPEAAGCVLLDLRMPGRSGLELQTELAARGCRLPIIFITGHGDVSAARSAFLGGALDFLQKPVQDAVLFAAVRDALQRDRERRRRDAAAAEREARLARLTPREREVMQLACDGHSNTEIATRLGISPRTVEVHKAHLMMKLDVATFAELLQLSRREPAADNA